MSGSGISSSISGIIEKFTITGHPYLDTLIISSVIPILIGYISTVSSAVKSLIGQLFTILWKYVRMVIKTRTIGNLLCKIHIDQNNDMFPMIKNMVFRSNIESDVPSESIFGFLSLYDDVSDETDKSSEDSGKYIDQWYKQRYEMDRTFNIQKNYKEGKFISTTFSFGYNDIERKFFRYNDFLLKFIMRTIKKEGAADVVNISVEILTFKTMSMKREESKQYVDVLERFLKDKFNMENEIYYVYKMKIVHDNLAQLIFNMLHNGFINSASGLLSYGDDSDPKHQEITATGDQLAMCDMLVDMKIENISDSTKSLADKYNFYDNTKSSIDSVCGFDYLYHMYISSVKPATAGYGYFVKNGDIYFIYMTNRSHVVEIVSFSKRLTDTDIKERLDMLRKIALNNNTSLSKSIKIEHVYVYKRIEKKWTNYQLDPRSFSTIYLPTDQLNDIKAEIDKFITYEKLYKEYQIGYKKGILLHGPPGTGKTSLVKAIAYEYQLNIYMVDINDDEVNDESIVTILNSLGGGIKILLFEDIDGAFADKEKIKTEVRYDDNRKNSDNDTETGTAEKDKMESQLKDIGDKTTIRKKFLTYSGLLNAMDGVLSNQHGLITIMTTNHIEKLGDAFIRPGRIDRIFHLKECDKEQIVKMTWSLITKKIKLQREYAKLNNQDNSSNDIYTTKYLTERITEFATKLVDSDGQSKIKPCELQQYILTNIDDIDDIFNNYRVLLKV
jgi:hypothetical protein